MSQLPWNVGSHIRANYHIKYSQNFIYSDQFAKQLIDYIHLDLETPVFEIAAGTGAFTKHLARKSNHLTAIEKDDHVFTRLEQQFKSQELVSTVNADLFEYQYPKSGSYCVVGNIPFAFTSDILKFFLNSENPPSQLYLLIQQEAAARMLGTNKESLFSLTFKPWFESKLLCRVNRSEFKPSPQVDGAWICVTKRDPPLVDTRDCDLYLDFLAYCFTNVRTDFYSVLTKLFSKVQLKIISQNTNLATNISQIKFRQWLELFIVFRKYNYLEKQNLISGAYSKLSKQQNKLQKIHKRRYAGDLL